MALIEKIVLVGRRLMKGMDDDNQWYDYNFKDHDDHDDGTETSVNMALRVACSLAHRILNRGTNKSFANGH